MKLRTVLIVPAVGVLSLIVSVACSSPGEQCAKATVAADGPCTEETLQCPFSIDQPVCDGSGTTSALATSCVCTSGKWACPSPVDCPAPDDDGGSE